MPTPQEKLTAPKARVVTDLKGISKKLFFEDVIKQGISESNLLKHIIKIHYTANDNRF